MRIWFDIALGVLLALALAGLKDARGKADQLSRNAQASAYSRDSVLNINAQLMMRVPHVTDTVRQIVTTTRTLRDSVMVFKTDTLMLERYVWQTDTLRARCLQCAALLDTIKAQHADEQRATETFISFLQRDLREAKREHWYDRFSVGVGYGVTKIGSEIHAGPQVQFHIRAWP